MTKFRRMLNAKQTKNSCDVIIVTQNFIFECYLLFNWLLKLRVKDYPIGTSPKKKS